MIKISLIAASVMLSVGVAHAAAVSTTSAGGTPVISVSDDNSSTSVAYKQAVVAAQDEAVLVLATDKADVSNVFVKGAQAAEKMLGVTFSTTREAAIAILSISNN